VVGVVTNRVLNECFQVVVVEQQQLEVGLQVRLEEQQVQLGLGQLVELEQRVQVALAVDSEEARLPQLPGQATNHEVNTDVVALIFFCLFPIIIQSQVRHTCKVNI
jgi:hypothetical protein